MIIFLARVVDIGCYFYCVLIIGRVFADWMKASEYNPVTIFFFKATEPVLCVIRDQLPLKLRMIIDISPLIAFICTIILRRFLVYALTVLGS